MTSDTESATRAAHPGSARGKARATPKGRSVEPTVLRSVQELLGERPRRRDLLIEYLHLLQDEIGHLPIAHLAALAAELRLPQAEVYEVASFYAHFDLVGEHESPPPAITVRVCDSISCVLSGAVELLSELPAHLGPNVRVLRAPCMGRCAAAPVAEVGHRHLEHADPQRIAALVATGDLAPQVPDYDDLPRYLEKGGYRILCECRDGRRSPQQVIETLEHSALRGLGGAGFPVGRKWRIVREYPGPRLMAVNADEGEPGTFKDRHYLETDPHRFLEGMLIAAWAVDIEAIYVYVRDEYPAVRRILSAEIDKLAAEGLLSGSSIEIRRGAGAYICGEESAMIESIEGKRGLPRNRPPYVAEHGLFGRPTLEHNVETLHWVRDILDHGADWFVAAGRNGRQGLRTFSVSGRVKTPGVKLAPAGITARELIDEYCDGMLDGHRLKAYLPGGASGGILPARLADQPLDFGTLEQHGCFIGSAAIVVFSDRDDMREVARNLMQFFEDESCGQCTPCRVGTEKAVALLRQDRPDADLLRALCELMADASICGLGQAAGNPVLSLLRYFPEDCS